MSSRRPSLTNHSKGLGNRYLAVAHSESQYPVSYPAVYTSSCTSSTDGAYLPTY